MRAGRPRSLMEVDACESRQRRGLVVAPDFSHWLNAQGAKLEKFFAENVNFHMCFDNYPSIKRTGQ
jgi:hypothetical protein